MEPTSVGATAGAVDNSSPSSDDMPENQGERQQSIASSKDRTTVPSACVQCRSKHLKCDGSSPCSRCSVNNFECVYVRSRRGFKGPRRNGSGVQSKTSAAAAAVQSVDNSCPLANPPNASRSTPHTPGGPVTPPDHRIMVLPRASDNPLFDASQDVLTFDPKPLPSGLDLRERCLETFYYHFFPAHPFMIPRASYFTLRKEKPIGHLEAAMRYVGSFYVPQAPTVALQMEAERLIYHRDCRNDGFRVQAMLVLAIGLDGYTYQEKALQVLLEAQDLAIQIGMNKRDFPMLNGNGSNILEESWRRTWWELYIVDGMVAGVHQKSNFRMKDMPADVLLPCEEYEYEDGVRCLPPYEKGCILLMDIDYTATTLPRRFR